MVQFKDVFLGAEKRSYTRATSSQRCVRAGGKHNDLDQVGYTARHHTFFEMLGNFSFGDYFKRDAIAWAWELLTQVWKLPPERLLVTIYHTDDEAFDIWNKSSACRPSASSASATTRARRTRRTISGRWPTPAPAARAPEIFYDHGAHIPGGPPGSPDEDGDRYIEIWNNVFMQFDRQPDGTLVPLPAPCVDTGMGLERLAAVLQHVHSNYEIDLFQRLIRAAATITHTADLEHKSLRVIADHIRACSFLIVDGVLPSNEGRGYVLRRIIRRAVRHFWKLGALQEGGAFWRMVWPLCDAMGNAYPELIAKRDLVERSLKAEEAAFAQTLDAGMQRLEGYLHQSDGALSGEQVFQLHDTYGCPPDLIADILREKGMTLPCADHGRIRTPDGTTARTRARRRQVRRRHRVAGRIDRAARADAVRRLRPPRRRRFARAGHRARRPSGRCIARGRRGRDRARSHAVLRRERWPGRRHRPARHRIARFDVRDTLKLAGQFHGHVGTLATGALKVGDRVSGSIDAQRRSATVLNHSATHLLHSALRTVLGTHVTQKGSLVAPDRLRFDFSHFQPVTAQELATIERMVNAEVRGNHSAEIHHMGMQEALDFGAMALFGEKYGENVRVLRMGETSTELCGGTHVSRTGDIGLFKIVSEGGVSAGVRRIEAVTGQGALDYVTDEERRLNDAARLLGGNTSDVNEKLRALLDRQKKLERELEQMKAKAASGATSDLAGGAVDVNGTRVLAVRLEGFDAKALRDAVDRLKQQLGDAVIVLAGASEGKAALVAGVSGSASGKVKAGELLAHVASRINGKGGGRPDLAQGGGDDGPALQAALEAVPQWVAERLH
jgi:alanyl-tRNA synthetase